MFSEGRLRYRQGTKQNTPRRFFTKLSQHVSKRPVHSELQNESLLLGNFSQIYLQEETMKVKRSRESHYEP